MCIECSSTGNYYLFLASAVLRLALHCRVIVVLNMNSFTGAECVIYL